LGEQKLVQQVRLQEEMNQLTSLKFVVIGISMVGEWLGKKESEQKKTNEV
jgi:hypothetical protein